MPTYLPLFDSADSASITTEMTITWTNANTVIAGMRYRLLNTNLKLPANATCTRSSAIAGTHVAKSRKAARMPSFPNTYSRRVSGFDKQNCRAFARRSFAIRPAPTYTVIRNITRLTNHESSMSWNVCALTARRLCPRSEEHTSELQSHSFISYAVFCLKKKTT